MKIIVDTCTFLWLASELNRVSQPAWKLLRDEDNELYLSAASAWEITLKFTAGKLPLPDPPAMFIRNVRDGAGLDSLPLTEEDASFEERLPRFHRDPFDRLLIAQALANGMAILTPDEQIARYPVRVLW